MPKPYLSRVLLTAMKSAPNGHLIEFRTNCNTLKDKQPCLATNGFQASTKIATDLPNPPLTPFSIPVDVLGSDEFAG